MKRWSRFLERVLALAASPGFAELGPAEQDRLFEQVARATRAERLLATSWPPHLFYTRAVRRRTGDFKNRPSGGPL
jgi:hypothetical protein